MSYRRAVTVTVVRICRKLEPTGASFAGVLGSHTGSATLLFEVGDAASAFMDFELEPFLNILFTLLVNDLRRLGVWGFSAFSILDGARVGRMWEKRESDSFRKYQIRSLATRAPYLTLRLVEDVGSTKFWEIHSQIEPA